VTDKDFATYYPGRYVRRKTKHGPSYIDRETRKRVSEATWTAERERIREAAETRRAEREAGRTPTTKVPVWIPPHERKEREKKQVEKKKKYERDLRWEQERRRAVEERKEAKRREDERTGPPERKKEEPKKEEPKYREGGHGGVIARPPEEPGDIEYPPDYEDIEYFDVDEVSYSTD
jgi:hypothetical protein